MLELYKNRVDVEKQPQLSSISILIHQFFTYGYFYRVSMEYLYKMVAGFPQGKGSVREKRIRHSIIS